MALSTLPVGAVARRHGRHAAFFLGNGCGVVSGLLASLALVQASFVLFCIAMLFGGAYAAVVLTFRFAAAECVPAADKPRALSLVLAGGVFAGVLGPQLVTATMNQWPPHAYAATYLCAAAVSVLSALVLRGGGLRAALPRPLLWAQPHRTHLPRAGPSVTWCASPALWWPCCAAWSATC